MDKKPYIANYGYVLAALLVVAAGFVTFFGNWLGSVYGGEVYIKALKDVVLFGSLALLLVWLATKDWRGTLTALKKPYNLAIAIYALLHLLYIFLFDVDQTAELAGLNFNLRFFALFVMVQLLSVLPHTKKQQQYLLKAVVALGVALAFLAMLQVFVLPKDTLGHFGYSLEDTGLSYYTIDNDPSTIRANATTRGPNELGAFLLIPLTLIATKWLWDKGSRNKKVLALFTLLVLALLLTFSRSAFLGVLVSFMVLGWVWARQQQARVLTKKRMAWVLGLLVLLIGVSATLIVVSPRVQQIVFHVPLSEVDTEGSDFERLRQQSQAVEWVAEQPEGYGLGTAGPSSFYNPNGVNITENYYLQVATEVGVIGLLLFLTILFFVIRELLQMQSPFGYSLLASFAGLSFISLLLHGWADDLTSYAWWGLAGVAMSRNNRNAVLD